MKNLDIFLGPQRNWQLRTENTTCEDIYMNISFLCKPRSLVAEHQNGLQNIILIFLKAQTCSFSTEGTKCPKFVSNLTICIWIAVNLLNPQRRLFAVVSYIKFKRCKTIQLNTVLGTHALIFSNSYGFINFPPGIVWSVRLASSCIEWRVCTHRELSPRHYASSYRQFIQHKRFFKKEVKYLINSIMKFQLSLRKKWGPWCLLHLQFVAVGE